VIQSRTLQRQVKAPLVDLNYGVGRRIQLKLEMPWFSFKDVDRTALNHPARQ